MAKEATKNALRSTSNWGIIRGDKRYFNPTEEDPHYGAISASQMGLILKKSWRAFKDHIPTGETYAFQLGSALHDAVLRPGVYKQTYRQIPEKYEARGAKNTNDYKAWRKEAETKWDVILDRHSIKYVEAMAASFREGDEEFTGTEEERTRAYRMLFEWEGRVEYGFWYKDPETGILYKIKPDRLCFTPLSNQIIPLDIKTTLDASKDGFIKDCKDYDYPMRAAFYLVALKVIFPEYVYWFEATSPADKIIQPYHFLCVEKSGDPFKSGGKKWKVGDPIPKFYKGLYTIDDEQIKHCIYWVEEVKRQIAMRRSSKLFPGYSNFDATHNSPDSNTSVKLPPYYMNRFNDLFTSNN